MNIIEILRAVYRKLIKKSFLFWEVMGIHVIPNYFYEPIPDTKFLRSNKKIWETKNELMGVDLNIKTQLDFLKNIFPKYQEEYKFPLKKTKIPYEFYINNGWFSSVDAEVLHCMIRYFLPNKIIEIGSGMSTFVLARASLFNYKTSVNNKESRIKTELFTIDPYPKKVIRKGFPGLDKFVQKKVEDVNMNIFLELEKNDIIFIDSSHVVKIGGDVNFIYLDLLTRLKKGVIIHIHDIFLPCEYPKRNILKSHLFWTEQYILHAFLINNYEYEILWAGYFMHLNYSNELKSTFPSYNEGYVRPGSFWIRKK